MKQIITAILASFALTAAAEVPVQYQASLVANASTGEHAPYMIGSWNRGRITGASGIWVDARMEKTMTLDRRFNWGAGVEVMGGYGSATAYDRYDADSNTWGTSHHRQSPLRLQQAYAEVKYRGVYLTAGMKDRHSYIVDESMSSGDLTRSNNARAIPSVSTGFVDFQDIPFTRGWLQIDGEVTYGRFFDVRERRAQFNYYTGLLSYDNWYTYKCMHFRTKPTQPVVVTFGMQQTTIFAGYADNYRSGKINRQEIRGFHIKDIFKFFVPLKGSGEGFVAGQTLGSIDLRLDWNVPDGSHLAAYFQGPFEDGSGIGRANGFDGLWGLQYDFARPGLITKATVEYVDFTNMSGPIHYAPNDWGNAQLVPDGEGATGGDNYYNNEFYGPYTNYGMGIGSPFPVAPLYNLNGNPEYIHNRARGCHVALAGQFAPGWQYVAKYSFQEAGGDGRQPARRKLRSNCAMIEGCWAPVAGPAHGLTVGAKVAFDAGKLRGNNFGAMLSISYTGNFNIGKK